MKFDDDEYINRYLSTGEYPRIHDDIFSRVDLVPVHSVMDVGCCKGLLSSRLAKKYGVVVGIDPNESYLDKAIQEPGIVYRRTGVDFDTLGAISDIIKQYSVKAVFARRVLPEICDTGGLKLVRLFIETLYTCKVDYVIIEGRRRTNRAVNPLKDVEEEVKMFDGLYEVIDSYKEVRVLKRNEKL